MSTPVKVAAGGVGLVLALFLALVAAVTGVVGSADYTEDCATGTPAATGPLGDGIEAAAQAALAYWEPDDAVTAVAVAGAESTWNRTARNPTVVNGSQAHGLWQIMLPMHADLLGDGDWADPLDNARVAHTLWQEHGWVPWVAHTSGAYREHLPAARAAVAAATDTSGGIRPAAATDPAAPHPAGPHGVQPHVAEAAAYVRSTWGFNGVIGGHRFDPGSEHHHGLALDIMVDSAHPIEKAMGDQIAAYFAGPGAAPWGVNNIIWMQRITNAGRNWAWGPMDDRGSYTANHYDHVHVDFHPEGGAGPIPAADTSGAADDCLLIAAAGGSLPIADDGGVTVASFNVLGHSHTINGGRGRAPGPVRARAVPVLFDTYGVTVAGMQEFQEPQVRAFHRATDGAWGMFHPRGKTVNAVVWRESDWEKVDGTTVTVPYFRTPQPQTAVLLRHLDSDALVWFLNVHNPANVRGPAAHKRAEALRRELALIDRLHDTAPVVFMGDMNEKRPFYCTIVAAGLHASNGGSNGTGPCRLPEEPGIDWIVGTTDVGFSGYRRIDTPLVDRTSDHPLVIADIH